VLCSLLTLYVLFDDHTFFLFFFFFNATSTTEIYTLSLHDALPICCEAPILFERRRFTESVIEDRDAVLRLGLGHIWQQQEDRGSEQESQCQESHFVAFPLQRTYPEQRLTSGITRRAATGRP